MTRQEIFKTVQNVVAEELVTEQQLITLDANLIQDLGADYLDLIAVFKALEDALNTKISYKEAKQLVTVQQVVNYLEQKIRVFV